MSVLPLVACALALPFFLWGFRTYQLAFAAANAIAILGLNLIAGQGGVISLGHGAFYGLGAYTMAVVMRQAGASAYTGIVAAPLVCLVAGYAFGRIVAPLARFYLAPGVSHCDLCLQVDGSGVGGPFGLRGRRAPGQRERMLVVP